MKGVFSINSLSNFHWRHCRSICGWVVFKSESDACSLKTALQNRTAFCTLSWKGHRVSYFKVILITDLYKSFYKTENAKENFKKFNFPEIDYNNLQFLRPAIQAPPWVMKIIRLVFSQENTFMFFLVALISCEIISFCINFPKHPKLSWSVVLWLW